MKFGPDRLLSFSKKWPTDKGGWFPGEKVLYREKNLFEDFNDRSWMSLLLYGISGSMPSENQARMVEKLWSISTSFPDPRLWNNRIAALAGSTRSTGALAVAASTAASEAKILGARPFFKGIKFLQRVSDGLKDGQDLDAIVVTQLKQNRVIPGFGRPITSVDERVAPLLREAEELGFGDGQYLSLIKKVEDVLSRKRYRMGANIAIYCGAILTDMGYSPDESYLISVLTFSAGIIPCYTDGLEKPEGTLFPLRCCDIDYRGREKRRLQANEN